jgi:hypothetical protein
MAAKGLSKLSSLSEENYVKQHGRNRRREQGRGGSDQQAANGDHMIRIMMEAESAIWERKKHN